MDGDKPRLRGRFHQIAFFVSIPAGMTLVALGRTGLARALAAVYSVSISALFGISAAYHRLPWSPRGQVAMRRLDHSAIYLGIAGTYTPLSLLALDGAWRWTMLGLAWSGAAVGITLKLGWIHRFSLAGSTLYGVIGWLGILVVPQVARNAGFAALALMLAGGMLYSAGGIMFALGRPRLSPSTFGFHELWHTFTIGAAACHYALVMVLVAGARP